MRKFVGIFFLIRHATTPKRIKIYFDTDYNTNKLNYIVAEEFNDVAGYH